MFPKRVVKLIPTSARGPARLFLKMVAICVRSPDRKTRRSFDVTLAETSYKKTGNARKFANIALAILNANLLVSGNHTRGDS